MSGFWMFCRPSCLTENGEQAGLLGRVDLLEGWRARVEGRGGPRNQSDGLLRARSDPVLCCDWAGVRRVALCVVRRIVSASGPVLPLCRSPQPALRG